MIDNEKDLRAAISDGGGDDDKPVTNQNREDWNQYVSWLKKRGIAGDPSLDKNNLGKNMLAKYIKENPKTSLTEDSVIPIQKDFSNYRQWAIDNIKKGKGEFSKGTDENNFMQELSIVDGYPGQNTTKHQFPSAYLSTFDNGKLIDKKDLGFATTENVPK